MSANAGRVSETARSKLEELLDSIRNRDDRPKDKPPDLPTRPISKGRLPKSKKSSSGHVTIPVANGSSADKRLKIKDTAFSCWILGSKGARDVLLEESPYDTAVDSFQQDASKENGNGGFNSEVPFKVRTCPVVLFIAFQMIESIIAKFKINDALAFIFLFFLC